MTTAPLNLVLTRKDSELLLGNNLEEVESLLDRALSVGKNDPPMICREDPHSLAQIQAREGWEILQALLFNQMEPRKGYFNCKSGLATNSKNSVPRTTSQPLLRVQGLLDRPLCSTIKGEKRPGLEHRKVVFNKTSFTNNSTVKDRQPGE